MFYVGCWNERVHVWWTRVRVSAAIDPIISRAVWTGVERGRERERTETPPPTVCNRMIIDQGKEREGENAAAT